ncbi:MAG: hypothetical protein H6Q66_2071 [Firmicutes bacterium]|nr:hypothetical protein [Bacillota bacterium]
MMQEKLSKSSISCRAIGTGKLLAYLRGDLQKTVKSIDIIGPWLDGFVARELTACLRKSVRLRCLVRVVEQNELASDVTYQALQELVLVFPDMEARSLEGLHAKVIVVDEEIVYLGSTNWYRYSLEQAKEITVRMAVAEVMGLPKLIEDYWQKGQVIDVTVVPEEKNPDANAGSAFASGADKIKRPASKQKSEMHAAEINHEVLDPIALKVLQANPKAYVKMKKR